jgi:hypothetical protein
VWGRLRGFVQLGEQAKGKLAVGVPMAVWRLRGRHSCGCTRGHVGRFIARDNKESDRALVAKEYLGL